MSRFYFLFLALLLLANFGPSVSAQEKQEPGETQQEITPESLKQKASYLIGYNVVKDMQREEVDFDLKEFLKGIQDAAGGKSPTMTRIALDQNPGFSPNRW